MREILNSLTDSIVVVDSQGKVIFVNESLLSIMGHKAEEIDLNEINNEIKIDNNKIAIIFNHTNIREGRLKSHKIQWAGEAAKVMVVKWENTLSLSEKLKLSEKILDEIKEWICVRDLNNEFVYLNNPCLNYYNTTMEKAAVTMKEQLAYSKFGELMLKYDDKVIKNKINCTYEVERENDGVKEYYEINKFPILDEAGQVKYIGVALKDISLQKNVQYKILDNLNLINEKKKNGDLKINQVDESILENFRNIFYRFLNVKKFNILIYDKNEGVLKPNFPIVSVMKEHKETKYVPITEESINDYLNEGYEKILKLSEAEMGISDSEEKFYIVNFPIINQGEFKGIIAMGYDKYSDIEIGRWDLIKTICSQIGFIIKYIELSQRINEELRYRTEVENDLKVFLDVSADIILKADDTGIREVGRRCFEVLGWTSEEFSRMDVSDLVHPEELEETLDIIYCQSKTGKVLEWENRVKCANGFGKWISWRGINLVNSKGYMYFSGKDITCEKIVEERESEIEKVKQLEGVRNEFFANISHEFKTPINMIMSTSQLMKQKLGEYEFDKNVEAEFGKYINTYRQNGYRLLKLVNNLIDITKIDAGFYKIWPINVNIINVIEDIVLSVAEYCKGNNIELIFDTEVEEEVVACDPDQIERIILNLLSNAIKYTPENGEIRVNISIVEDYVVIIVKDTGRGIPKGKLDVIFERFVQGEDTFTRSCEGSGIGLSLVKGLIEIHGGNVEVESEEGVGSTFKLSLPRKQIETINIEAVNQEIKQSKVEKCSIEFADIYNL